MAEVRNTFLASKMNKDLDARIVPNGEYRDAQNVSINTSEGADVGALENVLGNIIKTNFGLSSNCKLKTIGYYMDDINERVFVLLTDYTDTSNDKLNHILPVPLDLTIKNNLSPFNNHLTFLPTNLKI